jgi:pyruvate/2-oxoacid:ferredoxin oxidoreductase alpha subunit
MTYKTFDLNKLEEIKPVKRNFYNKDEKYFTYKPNENYSPDFLPVGNEKWQVRLNASTHNQEGILQNIAPEALENTLRLEKKIKANLDKYLFYQYLSDNNSDILYISYGISSQAALEARKIAKTKGKDIDLLILKTLLPISEKYYEIIKKYKRIYFIEENETQILQRLFFGSKASENIKSIGSIGKMISPEKILSESI